MVGNTKPRVFEMQTRSWLWETARTLGRDALHLDEIPDAFLERLASLGFTHLWCMGVWTISSASRKQSIDLHRARRLRFDTRGIPESDIPGSPYAITAFEVDPALGGERSLARLRARLHHWGLGLMLDFIPNHVGADHPWVREQLDWFVWSRRHRPGYFELSGGRSGGANGGSGKVWVAHGRDPFFAPWHDTAQLDYRVAGLRRRMQQEFTEVAGKCDAMRVDMAMLVLSEVFDKTWREHPPEVAAAAGEFWHDALADLRQGHPQSLVLAEVYWELEEKLLELGFDAVYDKVFYDCLLARRGWEAAQHVEKMSDSLLRGGCRFLENHDEEPVAGALNLPEHEAAAFLNLAMPGMALIHDGQMEGRKVSADIRVGRRLPEPEDSQILEIYRRWMEGLDGVGWRRAQVERLKMLPGWEGNPSHGAMIALEGISRSDASDVVSHVAVVNLASHEGQVRLVPKGVEANGVRWKLRELLSSGERMGGVSVNSEEELGLGFLVEMRGYGVKLFRVEPEGRR